MTADQDLSARAKAFERKWRKQVTHPAHVIADPLEDAMVMALDIIAALSTDHERAVQAAVAKAVEAEREACADAAECVPGTIAGHIIWPPSKSDIAAAIRSRGVAG